MKDKCQKYESLFIFADEKTLEDHIKNCPDCKEEHEKMLKVSALVKETKPHFKRAKRHMAAIQKLCASFLFVLVLGGAGIYHNYSANSEFLAFEDVSVISQMGLPTDEYGLLMLD